MDPITISLIIGNAISLLFHAMHFKSRFRCGQQASCCFCVGDIEEDGTSLNNGKSIQTASSASKA